MDPITMAMMGGSLISGLAGIFGGGDDAKQYMDKAIQQIISTHVPDPKQQAIELRHYQLTGQLSPQLETTIKQDPSEFSKIVQNQQAMQAQSNALSQLQDLGTHGGLNLSDRAAMESQLSDQADKDRANAAAISDDMERRGTGGSGMELAAKLGASQSGSDRNALMRMKLLGGAQDRALQAIQGAGELGGKMESQNFNEQSAKAAAQDAINRFNTTNAQSVQQRNIEAQNQAQQANLNAAQKVANSNVDLSNEQEKFNKGLWQQQYENEMNKNKAIAGVYGSGASQANTDKSNFRQGMGGIASGLAQGAGAFQSQSNWDNLFKTLNDKNKDKNQIAWGGSDTGGGNYA